MVLHQVKQLGVARSLHLGTMLGGIPCQPETDQHVRRYNVGLGSKLGQNDDVHLPQDSAEIGRKWPSWSKVRLGRESPSAIS